MKCYCGGNANITNKDEFGRINDKKVTVYNVPVYDCDNCGFRFMSGSDSKKFAARIKEAVKNGWNNIEY